MVAPATLPRLPTIEQPSPVGTDASQAKIDTSVQSGEGPIVVGSPSRPPGLSALLDHGEVLSAGGYSVTVKEAKSQGDLVEITGP